MDQFTGSKHVDELLLELAPWLTDQHLKDIAAENLFAIDAEAPNFSIPVPRDDAHITIHDVHRNGKGIDDLLSETLLLFSLASSLRDFDGKVYRSVLGSFIEFCVSDREAELLRNGPK